MKKIISAILAASLSLTCAFTCVHAESRSAGISAALADNSEIHIIYNDTVVAYQDVKPVNTDGRVMIPFRAALESMGAKVDYDEATRTVTASKGDITINFSLDSDTIYINNNGEESTITMDVPIIIVDDRTMVPIRFMSNALGMQVGWSGENNTVVIADYSDFMADFEKVAPNLFALSKLDKTVINKSSTTFDVSLNTDGAAGKVSASASGNAEAVINGNSESLSAVVSVKSDKLSIDKAKADVIYNGGKIYIKTDALGKLSETVENPDLKTAAALMDGGKWYAVDIAKLYEGMGFSGNVVAMIETALASDGNVDVDKLIMSSVTTDGDAKLEDVTALTSMLDMYEAMDKYITIQTADGGYTVSISIEPEDFIEMINTSIGSFMTDEDKAGLAKMINCSLKAEVKSTGAEQTSDVNADINLTAGEEKLNLTLKLNEKGSKAASGAEITVPSDSVDITDIIVASMKK